MLMDLRAYFADKLAVPSGAGGPTAFGSQIDLTAGMGFNYQNGAVVATSGNTVDYPGNPRTSSPSATSPPTSRCSPASSGSFARHQRQPDHVSPPSTGIRVSCPRHHAGRLHRWQPAVQLPGSSRHLPALPGFTTTTVGAGGTGNVSIFLTIDPKVWVATPDAIV